jgi:hypothetical protein
MPFCVELVQTFRVRELDGFGAGGSPTVYRVQTVQVTGALRHHTDVQPISAGVSNQEITLAPLAASQPGSLLLLQANLPLDIRLNASNATMLSQILTTLIAASGAISALFVTNPNSLTDAVLRTELIGGGSLQAAVPLP